MLYKELDLDFLHPSLGIGYIDPWFGINISLIVNLIPVFKFDCELTNVFYFSKTM